MKAYNFLMIPRLRSLKLRAGSAGLVRWARPLWELWLTIVKAAGVRKTKSGEAEGQQVKGRSRVRVARPVGKELEDTSGNPAPRSCFMLR